MNKYIKYFQKFVDFLKKNAVHFYCFGFIGGLANKHIEIIADFMVAVFMSVAVCELLKGSVLYRIVFGKIRIAYIRELITNNGFVTTIIKNDCNTNKN